jgi:hypothetical protein
VVCARWRGRALAPYARSVRDPGRGSAAATDPGGMGHAVLDGPGEAVARAAPTSNPAGAGLLRMRLTGARSNPVIARRIEIAARTHEQIRRSHGLVDRASRSVFRLPMGAIQTAVLETLGASQSPLRVGEIQLRVEQRLGRSVSRHTVNSVLSVAARDENAPVSRTTLGRYRS